uniref:(northern house mosquito) hypothetical protein n=1 Tax=Culex pipiens TaxID=7175 RepID=A0A8D8BL32_CULPI
MSKTFLKNLLKQILLFHRSSRILLLKSVIQSMSLFPKLSKLNWTALVVSHKPALYLKLFEFICNANNSSGSTILILKRFFIIFVIHFQTSFASPQHLMRCVIVSMFPHKIQLLESIPAIL